MFITIVVIAAVAGLMALQNMQRLRAQGKALPSVGKIATYSIIAIALIIFCAGLTFVMPWWVSVPMTLIYLVYQFNKKPNADGNPQ